MIPEIDCEYIIVNMKKELDNFIFVDVVDETFFDKNALEKIENINKDLNRVIFIDYVLYKSDLLKSFDKSLWEWTLIEAKREKKCCPHKLLEALNNVERYYK